MTATFIVLLFLKEVVKVVILMLKADKQTALFGIKASKSSAFANYNFSVLEFFKD